MFHTKHLLFVATAIAAVFPFLHNAGAAAPFGPAKVSLIENKVYIGNLKSGGSSRHAADTGAAVTAKDFVATDAASRAELKFADSSIVRVGQSSIFSFDAGSRTLSLKDGSMLFYVPHDSGGGNIKTPSFTAAITGTVGKVSKNMIAILKGEVKVTIGGKVYVVPEGWALEVIGNRVRLFKFIPGFATEGTLYNFGGPLPGMPAVGGGNAGGFFKWLLDRPTHEPEPAKHKRITFIIPAIRPGQLA